MNVIHLRSVAEIREYYQSNSPASCVERKVWNVLTPICQEFSVPDIPEINTGLECRGKIFDVLNKNFGPNVQVHIGNIIEELSQIE